MHPPRDPIAALAELRRLDTSRRSFYEDPMTEYCGCTDDFNEAWDRRERVVLSTIAKHAVSTRVREFALGRLEKFMP